MDVETHKPALAMNVKEVLPFHVLLTPFAFEQNTFIDCSLLGVPFPSDLDCVYSLQYTVYIHCSTLKRTSKLFFCRQVGAGLTVKTAKPS